MSTEAVARLGEICPPARITLPLESNVAVKSALAFDIACALAHAPGAGAPATAGDGLADGPALGDGLADALGVGVGVEAPTTVPRGVQAAARTTSATMPPAIRTNPDLT